MKKIFAFVLVALLAVNAIRAELLLNEPFGMVQETLATNENVQGGEIAETGWTNVNYSGEIYINGATDLTWPDYQSATDYTGSAEYKATFGRRVATPLAKPVSSGSVFMAAVIRLSSIDGSSARDYLWALCNGTSSLSSSTANQFLRLYVQQEDNGFRLGIGKLNEKAADVPYSSVLSFGTYLVVAEYEFVSGDNNDIVRLYINPSKGAKPEADLSATADAQPDAASFGSAMLYSASTVKAALLLDDLRVSTDWESLWGDGDGPQPEEPVITADKKVELGDNGQTVSDKTYTKTLTVVGEHLKGDITISHVNEAVTLSTTTLGKDGGSYTVTLDKPKKAGDNSDTIRFVCGNAEAQTILVWHNELAKPAVGTEMLLNGSFESYSSAGFLGTSFDDWSWGGSGASAETSIVLDGAVAMRVQPTIASGTLEQDLYLGDVFKAGDRFEMTLHYYLVDLNSGKLKLDCYWEPGGGGDAEAMRAHEADILQVTFDDGEEQFNRWQTVKVLTHMPEGARVFRLRLIVTSKNSDVLFDDFSLKYAGDDSTPEPQPEADWQTAFVWDSAGPMALLDEHFDDAEHNKPLALDRWQNVAEASARPWWGFDEAKTSPVRGDGRYAKATAYQFGVESTGLWEMWLVTPPLDYRNAANQIFRFAVMGEYMPEEGNEALFEIYYIDASNPASPQFQNLTQYFEIPRTADLNNEWIPFELHLEGQKNIADVFYIAFRYAGPNGTDGAVTYYVDDVSWGLASQGMETVSDPATAARKILRDGRLLILRNGHDYDSTGRLLR